MVLVVSACSQGCARFPEFLQNFSERQILWRMCSVVFLALTLKLPIQTSPSVAPELPVSLRSGKSVQISAKRAHSRGYPHVTNTHDAIRLSQVTWSPLQLNSKKLGV